MYIHFIPILFIVSQSQKKELKKRLCYVYSKNYFLITVIKSLFLLHSLQHKTNNTKKQNNEQNNSVET